MYYGPDKRLYDVVEPFFKSRLADAGEANSITLIQDEKKLDEALVGLEFDILIFQQNTLAPTAADWLTTFGKKRPNLKGQILLAGDESDPVKIMKLIEAGFVDYLVLPPDRPLLIEKIALYSTGKRNSDMRQVYSMQMSQQTDLAKPGFIEELSEFDCKVRSSQKPQNGELMVLYSKAFSADMNSKTSVLARCYSSADHPSFKGQFISQYFFVGITADMLTNIRNALRKTFISTKQK